ncbi:MAG: F0F1 ATP synthase subunit B [Acidobacteria bacterium]|nr:F0F1 ATP synthase subunit B [Acidobacteriota bacterium]
MDNPLVQLDPGLFFWTIFTFLILLGLLARFAWRPLLGALESRQATIRQSLDDADAARQQLEQAQQNAEATMRQARVEADAILSDTRSAAATLREQMRQEAQAEAQSLVANAERQIQLERDRALAEVRREAVDVSLAIATKLIQRNITREDNEALIDDALKQVEARVAQ